MFYKVYHQTAYHYLEPTSLCYNEARMVPRCFALPYFKQACLKRTIDIKPTYEDCRERTDFFGNPVLFFTIPQPHRRMLITVSSEVEITPANAETQAQLKADTPTWEAVVSRLRADLAPAVLAARQVTLNSPMIKPFPELIEYARKSFTAKRPIYEAVRDLMGRIFADFDFVSGATTIATPLTDVLAQRRGVCQDFAHFMIGCLRAMGLAARYVSGYLETLPQPGQEKLFGADASHAWCSVFIPEIGWLDFDPTNNLLPCDQHVVVAWGRDFADVTPLKGVFFSTGQHTLTVSVDVRRVETEVASNQPDSASNRQKPADDNQNRPNIPDQPAPPPDPIAK